MDNTKLNTHFQTLEVDYLYHLGLDSSMDLKAQFGDVKFVVLTRAFSDADYFADKFTEQYYELKNINVHCQRIAKDERYHIYKVANTLIISHGVGFPSMLICLNEVVKLMWHAGVTDYQFIRLSPAGGIGVAENHIVIANKALNQELEPKWSNIEFGEYYNYDTEVADNLTNAVIAANPSLDITKGIALSSSSFFNGQARLNGATVTSYSREQRDLYLQKIKDAGVKGIDMESSCFLAFCKNFSIPATVILAIINNRLSTQDGTLEANVVDEQHIETAIKTAAQAIINYILHISNRS